MRRLLLSSFVLIFFSLSILLFQISCKKEAEAQTNAYVLLPASTTTLGGVIVGSGLEITNAGVLSVKTGNNTTAQLGKIVFTEVSNNGVDQTVYLSNYDGTGKVAIRLPPLPAGREFRTTPIHPKLSPDGKLIFFDVYESSTSTYFIYSCAIDGSNLKEIHRSNQTLISLSGVY